MTQTRDDSTYLHDMLVALHNIDEYVAGLSYEQFAAAKQVQHAVLFNLQIIGEAANHLDSSLQFRYPLVPWSRIIGMRNVDCPWLFLHQPGDYLENNNARPAAAQSADSRDTDTSG